MMVRSNMKIQPEKFSLETNLFLLGIVITIGLLFLTLNRSSEIKWIFIDSSGYKNTDGIVVSSDLVGKGIKSGGLHFSITYSYEIDGRTYFSDRVHFGATASDSDYAKNYVRKYPMGKKVHVYYDPTNPSLSVLEPEVKWYGLLWYVVVLGALAIFLFVLSAWICFRQ